MAWIKGSNYADDIDGTAYGDRIEGFGGDDWIWGHGGHDRLFGGAGDDVLIGGSGHDDLDGGSGFDDMEGGLGDDDYFVDSIGDGVLEYGGEGIDLVHTTLGEYALPLHLEQLIYDGFGDFTGYGNSQANRITGFDGDDALSGFGGADRLFGYAGDDTLHGDGGNDRLSGGSGFDWLFGGRGDDILIGGAGADDFHFDTALDPWTNVDRITDFQVGSDAILLDTDVFTRIGFGSLGSGAFVEGTRARDAGDRILYDEGSGRIFYDSDGTGAASAKLFAIVTPGTDLIASDFIGY